MALNQTDPTTTNCPAAGWTAPQPISLRRIPTWSRSDSVRRRKSPDRAPLAARGIPDAIAHGVLADRDPIGSRAAASRSEQCFHLGGGRRLSVSDSQSAPSPSSPIHVGVGARTPLGPIAPGAAATQPARPQPCTPGRADQPWRNARAQVATGSTHRCRRRSLRLQPRAVRLPSSGKGPGVGASSYTALYICWAISPWPTVVGWKVSQ